MFVRKSLAGIVTVALTGSVLALTAGSAHAVYTADPDDTTFTPTTTDVIGVGSDTSQNALLRIANAYNAQSPVPTARLSTFAATSAGTIPLPTAEINRPNGSGAGKTLLYNPSNSDIDFARSSSSLNDAEIAAGLQQFPFALDTLKMAVSGQVASHAPTSLTPAQIVSIYKGDITDWAAVGGTAGTIVPMIPQSGSGTRSFFVAQLKAANGGVDVQLAPSVQSVQEHDPAPIQGNADAIAPFSAGRAGLAGTALRLENGFSANRALYNVVRASDLGNSTIQGLFGEEGFVCSEAARAAIEAAGFKQLATAEKNGVCGQATQAATTNFTINTGPATTDDTDFIPTTSDIIGVGSDTSQHAVYLLAQAYNAQTPAPVNQLSTFAALGGGQIPLPSGAINRPNGSGAGKTLLYNPSNSDIDFARSSSSLNDAEIAAGLQQFPFALDTLKMAVSGQVASHAPTSLTPAQIVSIYKGDITDWAAVGGTAGTIVPMIPQSGSGTRSFFVAQLKAANGGVDVQLAPSVQSVQEHDPAPIQGNADAIAPFSAGRAGLAGTALRLENGFSADRALYNVVRGADLSNLDIQAIFGEGGFFCSDDARDEIIAAGFKQLDRPENNGVCGQATQAATTNFETNDPVVTIATTTDLTTTNPSAFTLRLRAAVTGDSGTPTGTVQFAQGGTPIGDPVSLIGGVATLNVTKVPGSYPVTAAYTPEDGTNFLSSEDSATGVVKKIKSVATGKATKSGSKYVATITVKYVGSSAKVSGGKVTVKKGSVTVGTGTVKNGTVTIKLTASKLKKGKNSLKAVWAGNAYATGDTSPTFTVTKK